jgi:hypothetical protein
MAAPDSNTPAPDIKLISYTDWSLVSRTKQPVSGVELKKLVSDPISNFIRAACVGIGGKLDTINTMLLLFSLIYCKYRLHCTC